MNIRYPLYEGVYRILTNEEYGNLVFAHNATFDINVLLCMMEKYNIQPSFTLFPDFVNDSPKTFHQIT